MPTATQTISPLKRALLTRVTGIICDLDEAQLEKAAGSAGSKTTLYRILTTPESIEEIQHEDPLAKATLQGRQNAEKLLAVEGGYIKLGAVEKYLGMTRQGISRRRMKNQLIAVDLGTKGAAYPVWQFLPTGGTLPGLAEVLAALAKQGRYGWGVLSFFLNRHSDLNGETPLALLRNGRKDEVIRAAEMEGEMGR